MFFCFPTRNEASGSQAPDLIVIHKYSSNRHPARKRVSSARDGNFKYVHVAWIPAIHAGMMGFVTFVYNNESASLWTASPSFSVARLEVGAWVRVQMLLNRGLMSIVHCIKRNHSVPLFNKEGLREILLDKSPSIPLCQRGKVNNYYKTS